MSRIQRSLKSDWLRYYVPRAIEFICLILLILVMVAVIYGLLLRGYSARSYFVAAGMAGLGALIVIVGLGQQAIAARDAATWREMAVWQIRAATEKLERLGIDNHQRIDEILGPIDSAYYKILIDTLIDQMVYGNEGSYRDEQ
ncbi:MAG: hypothetical protein M3N34_05950 [Pseudomonadota bacterium]|nr:hypothetical protein [Pseudomonadota bacterium]